MLKKIVVVLLTLFIFIGLGVGDVLCGDGSKDSCVSEIYHLDVERCRYHFSGYKKNVNATIKFVSSPKELLSLKLSQKLDEQYDIYYKIPLPMDISKEYSKYKKIVRQYLEKNGYTYCCQEPASISFLNNEFPENENMSICCKFLITDEAYASSKEEFYKKFEVANNFFDKNYTPKWILNLPYIEIHKLDKELEEEGYKLCKDGNIFYVYPKE